MYQHNHIYSTSNCTHLYPSVLILKVRPLLNVIESNHWTGKQNSVPPPTSHKTIMCNSVVWIEIKNRFFRAVPVWDRVGKMIIIIIINSTLNVFSFCLFYRVNKPPGGEVWASPINLDHWIRSDMQGYVVWAWMLPVASVTGLKRYNQPWEFFPPIIPQCWCFLPGTLARRCGGRPGQARPGGRSLSEEVPVLMMPSKILGEKRSPVWDYFDSNRLKSDYCWVWKCILFVHRKTNQSQLR